MANIGLNEVYQPILQMRYTFKAFCVCANAQLRRICEIHLINWLKNLIILSSCAPQFEVDQTMNTQTSKQDGGHHDTFLYGIYEMFMCNLKIKRASSSQWNLSMSWLVQNPIMPWILWVSVRFDRKTKNFVCRNGIAHKSQILRNWKVAIKADPPKNRLFIEYTWIIIQKSSIVRKINN